MRVDYLALLEVKDDRGKIRHLLRYDRGSRRLYWLTVFFGGRDEPLSVMHSQVFNVGPGRFLEVMGNDKHSGKLRYIGLGRCNREAL